eukprot:753223-Rhodomonas_salina.1
MSFRFCRIYQAPGNGRLLVGVGGEPAGSKSFFVNETPEHGVDMNTADELRKPHPPTSRNASLNGRNNAASQPPRLALGRWFSVAFTHLRYSPMPTTRSLGPSHRSEVEIQLFHHCRHVDECKHSHMSYNAGVLTSGFGWSQ